MMNYLKNIFITMAVLNILNPAQALELVNGTTQEFGMIFTDAQKSALPVITNSIKLSDSSNTGMSLAFTNIAETSNWFRLYENIHLYGVDVSQGTLLGNWPLTRWQYEPIENEVKFFQADIYKKLYQKVFNPIGCLDEIPLNQGDLDADGKSELILFLGYDLVVFSPEAGRIVFMINYTVPGWMSLEGTAHHHEANWIKEGDEGVPQYQNLLDEHYGDALAGLRGYAKLYVGDFDKNGQSDILVWRKLYDSNMQNNPVKGFHKLKDSFYHYEKSTAAGSTGEYLPQETDPGTIQSWLATNTLTWQQGYPSKSECEGEEGQLIPEMHDPLLNDPDVLH